jgi:hypothetical protein
MTTNQLPTFGVFRSTILAQYKYIAGNECQNIIIKIKGNIRLLVCRDWYPLGVPQNRSGHFVKTKETNYLPLPATEARFLEYPSGSLRTGPTSLSHLPIIDRILGRNC